MVSGSEPIKFPYNRDKAIQVALWLLNRHGGTLDRLKLVKLIFFADRKHLARYGKPIVGGNYCAMKFGPVLSEFLDDLNKAQKEVAFPFESATTNKVYTNVQPNEELLSESDIKILEMVDKNYGRLDPFKLAKIAHALKAWEKNYPNPNDNTSYPLPYEDFFLDEEDDSMLEIIKDDQEAWIGFE